MKTYLTLAVSTPTNPKPFKSQCRWIRSSANARFSGDESYNVFHSIVFNGIVGGRWLGYRCGCCRLSYANGIDVEVVDCLMRIG